MRSEKAGVSIADGVGPSRQSLNTLHYTRISYPLLRLACKCSPQPSNYRSRSRPLADPSGNAFSPDNLPDSTDDYVRAESISGPFEKIKNRESVYLFDYNFES